MATKNGADERVENTALNGNSYEAQKRPTFGQKVKNHYKRFWWVHIIIWVLGTLLVTLLLIFVAFPRIAQSGVNSSSLTIISQNATNPTPNSVHLQLTSEANSSSIFTPTLAPFNASLFLPDAGEDQAFGMITIPQIHATKHSTVTVDQTLQILNMQQFINYNIRTLNSETYQVSLAGKTTLKLGGLPTTHVTFSKTTTVNGLNSFKGFKVQTLNVSLTPQSDGSNTFGSVFIPNPSSLTLELGNVTMDLSVEGMPIGNTTLINTTIRPGNNIVEMRGVSNQTTVLKLITTQFKDGILPVSAQGVSAVFNGQHLPYYEAALKTNIMNTTLNVGAALEAIGVNLAALEGMGTPAPSSSSTPSSSSSPVAPVSPLMTSSNPLV